MIRRFAFAALCSCLVIVLPKFAEAQIWELLGRQDRGYTWRAKVPGGWLVKIEKEDKVALEFLPDNAHAWTVTPSSPTDPAPGRFLKLTADENPPLTVWIAVGEIAMIKPRPAPVGSTIMLRNGTQVNVREEAPNILVTIF